jgi:hypothetical protein
MSLQTAICEHLVKCVVVQEVTEKILCLVRNHLLYLKFWGGGTLLIFFYLLRVKKLMLLMNFIAVSHTHYHSVYKLQYISITGYQCP